MSTKNLLLNLSLGAILGAIVFGAAEQRLLLAAVVCFMASSTIFTTLKHRRYEIITFTTSFLLMFFNYNLRSEYLQYYDWDKININSAEHYWLIDNNPTQQFFQDKFILAYKKINPNIGDRFNEIFLPLKLQAQAPSKLGLTKGDIVQSKIRNKSKAFIKDLEYPQSKFYTPQKVFNKLTNIDLEYVSHPLSVIDRTQTFVKNFYYKHMSEENAQITCAMLFGTRVVAQSEELSKQVRNLGLSHFFASSGFHLVVLLLLLNWIFELPIIKRRISLRSKTIILILLINFYGGLAGFSPSIMRAQIVSSIYLLLNLLKRKGDSIKLLFITAGLMLIIDPYSIFDIGFQFSYLATLSILIWSNRIKQSLRAYLPIPDYLQEIIIVSIASQILLFPFIVYYFHNLQVWSLIANIIFGPLLSLITLLSFTGLYFILEPLLNIFKAIINYCDKLPYLVNYIEINIETLFLLLILANLIAYIAFPVAKTEDNRESNTIDSYLYQFFNKAINNNYIRASLIFSCTIMILALNTLPIGVHKINFSKGQIANQYRKKDFEYFKVLGLECLLIKDLSSIDKLNSLHEVSILLLPNMTAKDIYLDTLLNIVKPQFIIYFARNDSSKFKINQEIIGSKAQSIFDHGTLYITDGKYWRIDND